MLSKLNSRSVQLHAQAKPRDLSSYRARMQPQCAAETSARDTLYIFDIVRRVIKSFPGIIAASNDTLRNPYEDGSLPDMGVRLGELQR